MGKALWVAVFSLLFIAGLFSVADCPARETPRLKVALVFDVGGRGDHGFNDSAYIGLERAAKKLGIKPVYIEQNRYLDRERALNSVASSDVDVIIGAGSTLTGKMNELATRYPGKKFVCIDYSITYDDKGNAVPPATNLAALTFREEEGSYLVGAIAALKNKTGKIGFIGGMDNSIIRKFKDGYMAGAKAVRPEINVLSEFAGITGRAFNNPEKGNKIAARMYTDGADIIYHAAGATGIGLFEAARKFDRFAIGVDRDQSELAPGLVLTSMIKNIDVAVFESIKACVEGRFSGGIKSLGLKENGVGFVYNDKNKGLIPKDIYNKAISLRQKIEKGEVVMPRPEQGKRVFSSNEILGVLSELREETLSVLKKVEGDLKQSASVLSGKKLQGRDARTVLKKLYESNPYIIDCETVSSKGIMLVIEPAQYSSSEGADISKQAHMVRLFKTKEPVLSGAFRSVEGPEAVAFHYPVFSPSNNFAGSVSVLFAPEYVLSGIISPVALNLPLDIFLMQTDGKMIYDVDARQIGLNVFNAPLYKPFPALIALAKKVAASKEGTGTYQFYRKGSDVPVIKQAFWTTVAFHGAEWRLVVACLRDNMEKQ